LAQRSNASENMLVERNGGRSACGPLGEGLPNLWHTVPTYVPFIIISFTRLASLSLSLYIYIYVLYIYIYIYIYSEECVCVYLTA